MTGPERDRKRPEGKRTPAVRASKTEGAVAIISRRAADRLRAGHVWVYRSDVLELPDELLISSRSRISAKFCLAQRSIALPRRLRCDWYRRI